MKHAYLILAHSDIPLLATLVSCLDDSRNDIYIHWDMKSGETPLLKTAFSRLYLLEERVSVNWAGFSMVEAEYLLFKTAIANGPYAYYHLLSGADLPIKSQDHIHSACERLDGTEFIAFAQAPQSEIDFRVQHRFLFPEDFKTKNILKRGLRFLYLKVQDLIQTKKTDIPVRKGSQWCSLTQDFVEYLLSKEPDVKQLFNRTFAPDELFVQTVCANSTFMARVHKADSEFEGSMRFIKWQEGQLLPLSMDDFPALQASDRWFARKFSSADKELISCIQNLIHV